MNAACVIRPSDILIDRSTSAGVAAAVQGVRMGKSVILIEPGRHVGELTVSGLGWTDTGDNTVIGGVAQAESLRRVGAD